MFLPWFLFGISLAVIIVLCVKIYLLKKSMSEICAGLQEYLSSDTNVLISISSGDRNVMYLAAELNKQLRQLREQRRRYLNGDRELKETITNISHDLRTPLTTIFGYLDLLEQEETSEDVTRYLALIENRVQALKQLIEELFRYSIVISTSENMNYEEVNVNSVLEESIAAVYATFIERGITPTICMPEKKIILNLNKNALYRVFSNLLNNALKYSDGDLDIILSENGEIQFINTAAALNEVQVGKLFNRFFSVETARKSTGLGLAISKTLVEQMNGTITAQYNNQKLCIRISFKSDNSNLSRCKL